MRWIVFSHFLFYVPILSAQEPRKVKLTHAEPLYMDLVRDLGARKGEKELNVGLSMEDRLDFHTMRGLVEYEFAPFDRTGIEVELPFEFHFRTRKNKTELPYSGIKGVKLATQYTFLVSKRYNLSLAVGYANDFEFHMTAISGHQQWRPENTAHPFLVAAKNWKTRFHTLVYAGPAVSWTFPVQKPETEWLLNANFHYMFPGTKNFLGLEINQQIAGKDYSLVLRPQARVTLYKRLMLGFVIAVPIVSRTEGLGMFCRLIYEPKRSRSSSW